MRILIDMVHPADVHFFRNAVDIWRQRGHEVRIAAREKDVTLELLDYYGLDYECITKRTGGALGLLVELIQRNWRLLRIAREFRPDVLLSFGSPCAAHVGFLSRRPSIVFHDSETACLQNLVGYPFATVVCTPECYLRSIGRKHVRFAGYKELAYLHPNHFTPDRTVLEPVGLSADERFFLVRFVSWQASHDWAEHGLSLDEKQRLISLLAGYGRPLISAEGPIPDSLQEYRLNIQPALIHHVMAFAELVVGESATMAAESAVLGVPAIYLSDPGLGYIAEQEQRYQLLHTLRGDETEQAFAKIEEFLNKPDLRRLWAQRRDRMLQERIDVTKWMVEFVEGFVANTSQGDRR